MALARLVFKHFGNKTPGLENLKNFQQEAFP